MEDKFDIYLGSKLACVNIGFRVNGCVIPFMCYSKSLLDELIRTMSDFIENKIIDTQTLHQNDPAHAEGKLPFSFVIDAVHSQWFFQYEGHEAFKSEVCSEDDDANDSFDWSEPDEEHPVKEIEKLMEPSVTTDSSYPFPITCILNRDKIQELYDSLMEQYTTIDWSYCGPHRLYSFQFPERPYVYYSQNDVLEKDANVLMQEHTLEHIFLDGWDYSSPERIDENCFEFIPASEFLLAFDHGYVQFHVRDYDTFGLRFFQKNEVSVEVTTKDGSPFGDDRYCEAEDLFSVQLLDQVVTQARSLPYRVYTLGGKYSGQDYSLRPADLMLCLRNGNAFRMSAGLDGFELAVWDKAYADRWFHMEEWEPSELLASQKHVYPPVQITLEELLNIYADKTVLFSKLYPILLSGLFGVGAHLMVREDRSFILSRIWYNDSVVLQMTVNEQGMIEQDDGIPIMGSFKKHGVRIIQDYAPGEYELS